MLVRLSLVAAAALVLSVGLPSAGLGECHLLPEESARLKKLSSDTTMPSSPDSNLTLGVFYLDHRCYAEARGAFNAVIRGTGERSNARVAASASGFLQLVDALELVEHGDLKLARDKLVQILREHFHTALLERAPFLLADILARVPDPEAWKVLEEHLHEMARRGSWKARVFLANRLLAEGRGAEAITQAETELAGQLELPRRIELQLELAHLLFSQRRLAEAQLLLASLDSEVGRTVLDRDLRINFLLLAVKVWGERVRRGGDPAAVEKLEVYSNALNHLDLAAKPWGFVQ
jgi:hypothetical protein